MNKTWLLVASLMTTSFLTSCNKTPPAPDPDPERFNVTCTDGVIVTNPTAILNTKYETSLKANNGVILPNEATVKINGNPLYHFFYVKKNEDEATFSIVEPQYITGPIHIELGLTFEVTVNEGAILEKETEIATPNSSYHTTLTAKEGYALPDSVASVKVNNKPLATTEYKYELKTGSITEADFSIEARYVKGPIAIELGLIDGYAVTVTEGVTLKAGTEKAKPQINYETDLTTDEKINLSTDPTVTINSKQISSDKFTYVRNTDHSASFSINAQYITGPIHIELGLTYDVTVTSGVSLAPETNVADPGIKYETTLTAGEKIVLPNNVTSVKVNDKPLATTEYKYELKTGSITEADFSIEGQYVKGPINIEIGIGKIYEAKIETSFSGITLSKPTFNTLEDYKTTISINDTQWHDRNFPNFFKVTSNGKSVDYTFAVNELKRNEGTLKIDKSQLHGDVVIEIANLTYKTKWYEFSDWWNYCNGKDNIKMAATADVGQIVGVEVNGLMHKVRLVDVEHTDTPDARCTFEFVNLITDSKKAAVTTNWNDDSLVSTNYDYRESTLNKFLNVDEDCVLEKLPNGLQQTIKEVNKKVGVSSDSGLSYPAVSYPTKLFPLSYLETIREPAESTPIPAQEGIAYAYYILHHESEDYIKKAVDSKNASDYWLRSPCTNDYRKAWCINDKGNPTSCNVDGSSECYKAVAPAFCI